MHRILSLILWLGVVTDLTAEPVVERLAPIHIVLVGDSTVTDSAGWGKAFADLLVPGVRCTNKASGGQSSKSFPDTGRWAKALESSPTYILIQFGHNDMPGKGPQRETDPQTTYRENLGRFVDEARAAGAKPILVTPVTRRGFDRAGKLVDGLAPYADAMKAVAAEKEVPLVDLHARSIEIVTRLGPEGSADLGPLTKDGRRDGTHFSPKGAQLTATLVADELRAILPELASLFEKDRYLTVVRRAADVLLAEGVDDYGPQKSAMIISVLDRKTGKPLEKLPKAPTGVRGGDRCVPYGSNANVQQDLYRVLDELSRITGDKRYANAAHAALVDFLRMAQHPDTGLLAWGEHLCWDCRNDKAAAATPQDKLIHEPKRDFLYFDLLYEAEPERMLKYARGLWDHQISNQKSGDFSRHAAYDKHGPGRGFDFPKEGGYFIDIWARAYEKTRDPTFTEAVQVLARRFLGRMNDRDLLDFDSSGAADRKNTCIPLWMPALALECDEAAARVDTETADLLKTLATRQDHGFLSLRHDPSSVDHGYVYCAYTDSGQLRPRYGTAGYSRHWGMGYGVNTTAMFALLCYARGQELGDAAGGEAYRRLVVEAADLYARELPDAKVTDIWAGEYGMAIFTEIAAFRLTSDARYLDAAKVVADLALADLWADDAALPRASTRTGHYEAITYPDTLLLSLLALHEHVTGLPPTVPISTLCR